MYRFDVMYSFQDDDERDVFGDAGLDYNELEFMDPKERREILKAVGLNPKEFDFYPIKNCNRCRYVADRIDVPSLATMYVDKPMKGHNLMQAIARVNRVYKDKEAGLVVDYIGMAAELRSALSQYTQRDKNKVPDLSQAFQITMGQLEVMSNSRLLLKAELVIFEDPVIT